MSAAEFGQWQAFLAEEPIGPAASLLHMASLLAAHANGPLKVPSGRQAWSARDFMPQLWQPEAPVTVPKAKQHAAQLEGSLARMLPAKKRKKR